MKQYVIGHRGAAGLAPENTLKAFRIGCESGAEAVECDVQLTKDKQIVVIHDATLDRTTDGHGLVQNHTLKEVASLNIFGSEKVPTLMEVYVLVLTYQKRLIIEIKGETAEQATNGFEATRKFIEAHQAQPNVEIHSFWPEVVQAASQNGIKSAFILSSDFSVTEVIEKSKSIGAYSVNVLCRQITEDLVDRVHGEGMEIGAWPLNTHVDFHRMKIMGVNALITDHPDRFTV